MKEIDQKTQVSIDVTGGANQVDCLWEEAAQLKKEVLILGNSLSSRSMTWDDILEQNFGETKEMKFPDATKASFGKEMMRYYAAQESGEKQQILPKLPSRSALQKSAQRIHRFDSEIGQSVHDYGRARSSNGTKDEFESQTWTNIFEHQAQLSNAIAQFNQFEQTPGDAGWNRLTNICTNMGSQLNSLLNDLTKIKAVSSTAIDWNQIDKEIEQAKANGSLEASVNEKVAQSEKELRQSSAYFDTAGFHLDYVTGDRSGATGGLFDNVFKWMPLAMIIDGATSHFDKKPFREMLPQDIQTIKSEDKVLSASIAESLVWLSAAKKSGVFPSPAAVDQLSNDLSTALRESNQLADNLSANTKDQALIRRCQHFSQAYGRAGLDH
jgi:hypothetical protein